MPGRGAPPQSVDPNAPQQAGPGRGPPATEGKAKPNEGDFLALARDGKSEELKDALLAYPELVNVKDSDGKDISVTSADPTLWISTLIRLRGVHSWGSSPPAFLS